MTALSRRLDRLTLLQRFLLLEVAIFLLVFAGVLFFVAQYAGQLRARIDHERLLVTRSFAAQLDAALEGAVAELRVVARSWQDAGGNGPGLLEHGTTFDRGILVLDQGGRVLESGPDAGRLTGRDLGADLAAAAPLMDGAFVWSFAPEDGRAPVLAFAVLVPGAGAGPADAAFAVGLVDAMSSRFTAILDSSVAIAETGHADVVDSNAIAILSTEREHLLRTSDHPALYRRQMATPGVDGVFTAAYEEEGSDEGAHAMGFVLLRTAPWGFALGGLASEAYAPIQSLWRAFFGLASVLGLFALTLTVVGVERLVRPVRQLSDVAHQVASGDVETLISVNGGGEIGELGDSVERMRASLYSWGRELDARVRARTTELERRHRELAASAAVAQAAGSTLETMALLEVVTQRIEESLDLAGAVVALDEGQGSPPIRCEGPRAARLLEGTSEANCERCLEVLRGRIARGEEIPLQAEEPTSCFTDLETLSELTVVRVPIPVRQGHALLCAYQKVSEADALDLHVLELLASQTAVGLHNASLYESLRQREERRRVLLMRAQEEERHRLARELHDGTAQSLAAVTMALDSLIPLGAERWDQVVGRVEQTRQLSVEALDELRMMILALRPPALDDLGLIAAIARYADRIARSSGIRVSVHEEMRGRRLAPSAEVAVFRVVQEALNNVARHSRAAEATVDLSLADGVLHVEIADDGEGFAEPVSLSVLGGVGIEGMVERARLLGGSLTVDSQPGQGTTVRLSVMESFALDEEDVDATP